MTGNQLKASFESLIDNTISDALWVVIANHIKNLVELMRDWEMLKAIDTSLSVSSGNTYLTQKSMASFSPAFLAVRQIYVGDDGPFVGIPFEHRIKYRSMSGYYYIDYRNNVLYITGNQASSKTITVVYTISTTDWTINNLDSVSPVWPVQFHGLIPVAAAEFYNAGVDYDEIQARQSLILGRDSKALVDALIGWDKRIKLASLGHSVSPITGTMAPHHDRINE